MKKESVAKTVFIVAICAVALVFALNILKILGIIKSFFAVLTPVVGGFCGAFVTNITMRFFERTIFKGLKIKHPQITRTLSILLTVLIYGGIITLILLVVIPQIADTVSSIINGFPAFSERALKFIEDVLDSLDITSEQMANILTNGDKIINSLGDFLQANGKMLVGSATTIGSSIISVIFNIFLGIFIAIFMLAQKEMMIRQISSLGKAMLSTRVYNAVGKVLTLSETAFSNFIGGQCIEAVILGGLCFVGMLIFGFPYPAVVAVLVGVSALIPILGAWIGGGLSFVLILIASPVKALWFLVFFNVLQQVENNLIYPRVVGKKVGLPGVWVLIAVVIGNGLIKGVGALLAVPIASVLYILLGEFVRKKNENVDNPQNVE